MKRGTLVLLAVVLLVLAVWDSGMAQYELREWSKGKVFLMNGGVLEGGPMSTRTDGVTIRVGDEFKEITLSDIRQLMVKKGLGSKGFSIGSGGCLALALLSYLASDDETFYDNYGKSKSESIGQYMLGAAIWSVICGGVGCLIGTAADSWNTIYIAATPQPVTPAQPNNGPNIGYNPTYLLGKYIE